MPASSSRRIGLEVSNSAVRMAEVSMSGGRPKLLNLGQVRLPARAVIDGGVVDGAAVTAAIERCVKEGGFNIKGGVHLGVAGLRAITRELDMPVVPDSELDAAVRLQALDVIPFPVDKTLLSARPLEDVSAPDGTPMRRVLLAAAHRDLVEPLVQAVAAAGLTPQSVDLSSSALVRALHDPSLGAGEPEAIVSVGSGLTTIVVHEDGVPHFVRTIAEGGDTITAAIAGVLDIPIDDAETTKRNLDQAGPHIRAAAVAAHDAADSLIAEIKSTVEYYVTLPGRREVRRVKLTGGGARLSGFAEMLQAQLRAEVVPGSALGRVDVSSLNLSPDDVVRRDPLVSTVIGLALPEPPGAKALDLLPPEILVARRQRRTERAILAAAAVIVLALVGLGVMRYLQLHNAQNGVAAQKTQIQSLKSTIARRDGAAREYADIKADQSNVLPILSTEVNWPLVRADLAKTNPGGGTITSFSGSYIPPVVAPTTSSGSSTTATTLPPLPEQTPTERENVAIATLSLSVSTRAGFAYYKTWFDVFSTSPLFRVVSESSLTNTSGTVTWTATVDVLGNVLSSRLNEFEVTSK